MTDPIGYRADYCEATGEIRVFSSRTPNPWTIALDRLDTQAAFIDAIYHLAEKGISDQGLGAFILAVDDGWLAKRGEGAREVYVVYGAMPTGRGHHDGDLSWLKIHTPDGTLHRVDVGPLPPDLIGLD